MTTPNNGDTVSIDSVLRRGDGEVVGTTEEMGPQDIELGSGQIFPQIEQALTGMEVGDEETVEIASDSAFGPRRDELVIDIPRENLPPEPAPLEEVSAIQRRPHAGTTGREGGVVHQGYSLPRQRISRKPGPGRLASA